MAKPRDLARLRKRLKAVPRAVLDELQPALLRHANTVADDMRRLAPEKTGALKRSIAVTSGGKSTPAYSQPGGATTVPANAVMITAGDTNVRYAHLVEYGTLRTPAYPFFWPAWRLNRSKVKAGAKRAITKAFRSTRRG